MQKLEASLTFLGWLTETGAPVVAVVEVEMLERLWYDGEEGFQNKNQELLVS